MKVVWQCEKDEFCRRVLAKHWPGVRCYEDVREIGSDATRVDVIAGGFPCQDLSHANTRGRRGLGGEKSGLWREFARVVSDLRPRVIVVENIYDNWRAWVPFVRGDLYRLGYASLHVRLCACQVGAPHHRPRVFVVAYPHRQSESLGTIHEQMAGLPAATSVAPLNWDVPYGELYVADGLPPTLVRRALGNAVVPQVAEVIGRMIVAADGA